MKFEYNGEMHDLMNIITKDNFLSSGDNDAGVNIILKQGIKEICDYFGFKDFKTSIVLCQDTKDFGTILVVEQTMTRPSKDSNKPEPIDQRIFVGDGEVNGYNFQGKADSVCYPVAVAKKRARSRAVLWELGVAAFGEEESEDFQAAVRNRKKTFTSKNNAVQVPKTSDSKPAYKPPIPMVGTPTAARPKPAAPVTPAPIHLEQQNGFTREDAQKKFEELKKLASNQGLNTIDLTNLLRTELNIKGYPQLTHFIENPEVFEKVEVKLKALSGK